MEQEIVSTSGESNKSQPSAREWLRAHGYDEPAKMIDEIEAEWKVAGKATRRNWWQVLAGDSRGNPRTIAGRTFPVVAAIRKRQSLSVVEHAQRHSREEVAPKLAPSGRWPAPRNRKKRRR